MPATSPAAALPQLPREPVETPWDPNLATAMATRGLRIEEELSLDALLADLLTAARPRP